MDMNRWTGHAGAIALAATLAVAAVQTVRLHAARSSAVRAAVDSDRQEAAADTTRALSYIEVLGDSLRAVQRRSVQAIQKSDKLDRALGLERAVRARLAAVVARLEGSARSETVFVSRGDSARRAEFDVREAPWTVHAAVVLPGPPALGSMEVRVAMDTLGLEVRVGCGRAGSAGVRPAMVNVVGPRWANVRLGKVEQALGVCSAAAANGSGGRWSLARGFFGRIGISVGYAAVRGGDGAVLAGPAVVAGLRVWP